MRQKLIKTSQSVAFKVSWRFCVGWMELEKQSDNGIQKKSTHPPTVWAQQGVTRSFLVELLSLPVVFLSLWAGLFQKSECNVKISRQARLREGFIVLTVPLSGLTDEAMPLLCHPSWSRKAIRPGLHRAHFDPPHCRKPFRFPADCMSWADKVQPVAIQNAQELF